MVRGVKDTEKGRLMVEITNYIGDRCVFTVTVSTFTDIWLPISMMKFLNSVKKVK